MRCVLENVIRTCRFYGPQFPPIDVSITMTIRNYITEVVTMIEDNLNQADTTTIVTAPYYKFILR